MGITASIYEGPHGRDGLSCIPADIKRLTIVNADGPFDPTPDAPAAVMERGPMGSIRIRLEDKGTKAHCEMFGGRYVAASDSRFGELAERLLGTRFYGAVALHDRREY